MCANYRDFFRLVVGPAGERDAEPGGEQRVAGHVAPMQHDDDDLVRRRARLLKALVRLVQQLLQLLPMYIMRVINIEFQSSVPLRHDAREYGACVNVPFNFAPLPRSLNASLLRKEGENKRRNMTLAIGLSDRATTRFKLQQTER